MNAVEKVIAYVTTGEDILVFDQPDFPEAGILRTSTSNPANAST
jgi:hypothetical protein